MYINLSTCKQRPTSSNWAPSERQTARHGHILLVNTALWLASTLIGTLLTYLLTSLTPVKVQSGDTSRHNTKQDRVVVHCGSMRIKWVANVRETQLTVSRDCVGTEIINILFRSREFATSSNLFLHVGLQFNQLFAKLTIHPGKNKWLFLLDFTLLLRRVQWRSNLLHC